MFKSRICHQNNASVYVQVSFLLGQCDSATAAAILGSAKAADRTLILFVVNDNADVEALRPFMS